jgi:hypothetical protein
VINTVTVMIATRCGDGRRWTTALTRRSRAPRGSSERAPTTRRGRTGQIHRRPRGRRRADVQPRLDKPFILTPPAC